MTLYFHAANWNFKFFMFDLSRDCEHREVIPRFMLTYFKVTLLIQIGSQPLMM